MKVAIVLAVAAASFITPARADLTIVQKVDGLPQLSEMTMKIKGDKVRMEAGPQITSIIDGKTGETVTLMHDRKVAMRMSPEQAKAAAAMMGKAMAGQSDAPATKGKLSASGKKETINGHETEEYIYDTPSLKASYWIAKNYPNGDAIMKEMQAVSSKASAMNPTGMPDYRDFPGIPLRTSGSMGGQQFVSTITAIKQDPISDAEFTVPKDYQDMKMPDLNSLMGGGKPDGAAKPGTSPKGKQ